MYETVAKSLEEKNNIKETEFKKLLISSYSLESNQKVEELYRIAYELGHSGGYFQILFFFDKLSILVE